MNANDDAGHQLLKKEVTIDHVRTGTPLISWLPRFYDILSIHFLTEKRRRFLNMTI